MIINFNYLRADMNEDLSGVLSIIIRVSGQIGGQCVLRIELK